MFYTLKYKVNEIILFVQIILLHLVQCCFVNLYIFSPLLSFYNCQFPDMVIEGSHANKYDKIFKENIEYALPGIIKNILGLTIVNAEEISHNLQHTKERKPDVLKKVTDQN